MPFKPGEKNGKAAKAANEKSVEVVLDVVLDVNKNYVFESIEKSMTRRHQIIGSTCTILDPITGHPRNTRYIPVADSIFEDEQGPEYDNVADTTLSIYGNILNVPGHDIRLLEYLLTHDMYEGNKNRISKKPPLFTLQDKDKHERDKSDFLDRVTLALETIKKTPISDLRPIARVMYKMINSSDIEVKNKLRDMAQVNPKEIIDGLSDPKLIRKAQIYKAVDAGIITFDTRRAIALWGGNEANAEIIGISPAKGMDSHVDSVVNFTYHGKAGDEFFNVLKDRLDKMPTIKQEIEEEV